MVTAELAVALPAVVLVLSAGIAGLAVVTAQLRATDAADLAARLAARGEPLAAVTDAARAVAPSGARLEVSTSGATVRVVVVAAVRPPGIGRLLPAFTVRAQFVEWREPGVADLPAAAP